MSEKSLSEDPEMCTVGWIHFNLWQELVKQRRPKAPAYEIRDAHNVYLLHRRMCGICKPWEGNE